MTQRKSQKRKPTVRQINKETLRSKVYANLREMIIAGELSPGETITLRGLSASFGVSVAPVREALVHLESEKVILRRDNRDYRVNTLSSRQFVEIFKIRRMLEPYLSEQACRKRPAAAVEEAREVLKAMRGARSDTKEYISLNRDFHFLIYSYAECPILLEIVSGLWARIGPYLTLNFQDQDVEQSLQIHASMLASFTRRDSEGFKKALTADMNFSRRYVTPLVQEE
jgi:DNA-binding GntR family transcriptional regulator